MAAFVVPSGRMKNIPSKSSASRTSLGAHRLKNRSITASYPRPKTCQTAAPYRAAFLLETTVPRNGSGTYSPTIIFVASTPALASDVNSAISDIGSELTNSVAKDGQTTMTGPLKAADGSASAPGITFGSDTNTGFFRKSSDTIGVASGGTEIGTFGPNGASFLPTGAVLPYAGASAPTGFLLCYGQAVSRTTYAALFSALSTTYGSGDGSTTFNLPDLRGRVVAGQDDMGGTSANRLTGVSGGVDGDVLGGTGGAETHVLTEAQLAAHTHVANAHNHGVTDPGHTHDVDIFGGLGGSQYALRERSSVSSSTTASATTGISVNNATVTLQNTGTDAAHNNVQPTLILNYIIKI